MSSATAGGERHLRGRGGLPRPSGPAPGAAGPRPGTPKLGLSGGVGGWASGGASPSGRAECNWWGAAARQAAAAPRRQRSRGSRSASARVPTGKGNRELVRRALSPPAVRGVLRRWCFRPAPSRLRNASSPSPSPATPRPRPS